MNRYDDNWAGREGTQWRVVLDGADGRTTGRPVQVQLEEDDEEDFFAPVRSWTGKLTLMADAEEARTLMPAGAQEAAATVTGAEMLGGETGEAVPEWCGYVRPETLTQPWPGHAGTATLTLQSRLATAGGRYLDADGGRGFVTLGALLREALLLCGFSDSDAIAWPSRWATAEGEPGLSVLGLRVSHGRFFADNQGGGDTEEGTEVDTADGKERTPFEVMTTADVAGRDGGGDALGGDAEDDAAWLLKDKVKNFAGTLEAPIPYVPKMVRDTALLRDTVTVALPVERAEYAGETADGAAWRAWLSGYRPRLDSLAVSWPERTVTERRGRWSVGITAGAGWTRGGFGPYIGIGLTYSLWSF